MKKNWKKSHHHPGLSLAFLIAALILFPSFGKAETLQGEVLALDEDGRSFLFKSTDDSGPGADEPIDIEVLRETEFLKISSLNDLAAGDEVRVEAKRNSENGMWEAGSVEILKVQLFQALAGSEENPVEVSED